MMTFFALRWLYRKTKPLPGIFWGVVNSIWNFFVRILTSIWKWLDYITKDPLKISGWLVWLMLAALLFKPLFWNSFVKGGWSAAFSEPTGFIVYIIILLVSALLLISAARSGKLKMDPKWQKFSLELTVILAVLGGRGYLLFFSLINEAQTGQQLNQAIQTQTQETSDQKNENQNTASLEFAVEMQGYENNGITLVQLSPGDSAIVTEISRDLKEIGLSGKWYDTTLWGYKDTELANYMSGKWKQSYCYSGVNGVDAGETLVVLGKACISQSVYQFLDGNKSITVTNNTDGTLPLTLYYHQFLEIKARPSDFSGSAKFLVKVDQS